MFYKKNPEIFRNSNSDITYKYNLSSLNLLNIVNWTRNRQPDQVRIKDLLNYFNKDNIQVVPGVIHIWYNPMTKKHNVYDGCHRFYAALNRLQQGIDMNCIVRIKTTNTEMDIVEDFKNINKSISVPTVYLEEDFNQIKTKVCENVANYMCVKHHAFVSPSRNCYKYNFNRDNLIELISKCDIPFDSPATQTQIINELEGLKEYAKDYVLKNKITHPKKCAYHNFFLFFLTNDFIIKRIESSF